MDGGPRPGPAPVRRLAGVALVTGSSSGIGEGIARGLAACGMHVVVHSARTPEAGAAVAASIGGSYLQADLADAASCDALVQRCLDDRGRLDVLVNNAGLSRAIPHGDLRAATPAVWHELLDVNVLAPWLLTTAAEAALRASGPAGGPACIVNISSHAGVRPKGASIPYAVSKAALNHMTRLLAVALGPDVRVNALAPGLVDVVATRDAGAAHALWRDGSVMGRPAALDDVVDVVLTLVANPYITGEVVVLDGGLGLR